VWWFTPVISALRGLRQEDCELEANLGYTVRLCLKKTKTRPGVVLHTCNLSYSEGRDQEDHGLKLDCIKKVSEIPSQQTS
jgi:hypothetical protein